jgi:hypothetical protein
LSSSSSTTARNARVIVVRLLCHRNQLPSARVRSILVALEPSALVVAKPCGPSLQGARDQELPAQPGAHSRLDPANFRQLSTNTPHSQAAEGPRAGGNQTPSKIFLNRSENHGPSQPSKRRAVGDFENQRRSTRLSKAEEKECAKAAAGEDERTVEDRVEAPDSMTSSPLTREWRTKSAPVVRVLCSDLRSSSLACESSCCSKCASCKYRGHF